MQARPTQNNANYLNLKRIKNICDYSKQKTGLALKALLEQTYADLEQQFKRGIDEKSIIKTKHLKCLRNQSSMFVKEFFIAWEQVIQEFQLQQASAHSFNMNTLSLVEPEQLDNEINEKQFIRTFSEEQASLIKTLCSGLKQIYPGAQFNQSSLPFLPLGLAHCTQQAFRNSHFDGALQNQIERQMTTSFFPKIATLYWGIKRHFENNGIRLDTYDLQRNTLKPNSNTQHSLSSR